MNALQQSLAIGPAGVSLSQIFMLLALLTALATGALLGRRRSTSVGDTLLNALLIGIAGARILFVLLYHDSYDSLWQMVDIRDGGFQIGGGIATAALYTGWALWRHPPQRVALSGGLAAGVLTWGLLAAAVVAMSELSPPLPDAPLLTLDGETVSLADLARREQKPLVVNIWATWCPPCIREMPVFAEAQRTRRDITFAFANQGENPQLVAEFLHRGNLELDHILLDQHGQLSAAVGARVLPTTLFYDAEGRLVHTHIGELSRATLDRGLKLLTGP
ncbi:MAG: TlpA disulfide reductase family protein [Porticoccaceae bacterium]